MQVGKFAISASGDQNVQTMDDDDDDDDDKAFEDDDDDGNDEDYKGYPMI